MITKDKKKISNALVKLIAESEVIQSLDSAERVNIEQKLLTLPESKIQIAIGILNKEKIAKAQTEAASQQEHELIDKISLLERGLNQSMKELDKLFREKSEAEDHVKTDQFSDNLLEELKNL